MEFRNEVELAIKGDSSSFATIIQICEESLYRVSSSILRSDSDSADAIQETIFNAFVYIKKLKKPDVFKTWLIRILINECYKILKKKKIVIPMERIENHSINTSEFDDIDTRVIIDSLEEDLKLVVTLYYFEDMAVSEIADLIKIPEGTVKSRLSRARKKLAGFLEVSSGKECAQ